MSTLPKLKSHFGDYEGTALHLFAKETVRLIQIVASVVANSMQVELLGALTVARLIPRVLHSTNRYLRSAPTCVYPTVSLLCRNMCIVGLLLCCQKRPYTWDIAETNAVRIVHRKLAM